MFMKGKALIAVALLCASVSAKATDYTGVVAMLEVWRNGNIAFSLRPAIGDCNGQVILNKSDPGFKNLYAAIMVAREAGRQVLVRSYSCGQAENYGGNYVIPDYIYPFEP